MHIKEPGLLEGLGMLIKDNDDARRTPDERVAMWRAKSEDELQHEMGYCTGPGACGCSCR